MDKSYFNELINFFNKYGIPLKDKDGYYRPVIEVMTEFSELIYKNK